MAAFITVTKELYLSMKMAHHVAGTEQPAVIGEIESQNPEWKNEHDEILKQMGTEREVTAGRQRLNTHGAFAQTKKELDKKGDDNETAMDTADQARADEAATNVLELKIKRLEHTTGNLITIADRLDKLNGNSIMVIAKKDVPLKQYYASMTKICEQLLDDRVWDGRFRGSRRQAL